MKTLGYISTILVMLALAIGCQKEEATLEDAALDLADKVALRGMDESFQRMVHCNDSLMQAQHRHRRQHFDSLYHRHDSLFQHHHGAHRHGNMECPRGGGATLDCETCDERGQRHQGRHGGGMGPGNGHHQMTATQGCHRSERVDSLHCRHYCAYHQ